MNLENALVEVFKTLLDKAQLPDPTLVINPLLKVTLSHLQNFLQKHVYNFLGFESSSLGVMARKLCLLCHWWFPMLLRPPQSEQRSVWF